MYLRFLATEILDGLVDLGNNAVETRTSVITSINQEQMVELNNRAGCLVATDNIPCESNSNNSVTARLTVCF